MQLCLFEVHLVISRSRLKKGIAIETLNVR
jgi:hypothetical protein